MAKKINRWKGFVLGVFGSLVGLLAMRAYWKEVAPQLKPELEQQGLDDNPLPQDLQDISLIGKQYQQGESSTAALGRIIYSSLTGKEPDDETKTTLSYLVHWGYGMFQGGVYGALRSDAPLFDVDAGLKFATGLWLLGDEMMLPLLGLQAGPAAASPAQHVNRWGAHLAYGAATALTTQFLRRIF